MESINKEQRYRREQEEFVSNHGGSTSREIILVILPSILSIFLTSTIIKLIGIKQLNNNRNLLPIIEFIINIIPTILSCTILSDHIVTICLTIGTISFVNFYIIIKKSYPNDDCRNIKQNSATKQIPFVTNFRALTNILTAICILAVDFRIFPRRFAKTEVFGYSLMDTGVGLFIVANALVAPETREFTYDQRISHVKKFMTNIKNCVRTTAPLLVLGFARFSAVELSNYQRHVTEYGLHWNFFITLAFVKIFISTVTSAISSRYSLISGVWIIAMHEYALSTKGLKEWVLGNAPRTDFVSANREGLVSIPGYVGLYLVSIAIGKLIYSTYNKPISEKSRNDPINRIGIEAKIFGKKIAFEYNRSMILCIKLSLVAPHVCGATLLCDWYFGISRRLANSGYCAWILTLSTVVLTLLLLVEIMVDILIHITTKDGTLNNVTLIVKKNLNVNTNNGGKNRKEKSRHVKFSDKSEVNVSSNKKYSETKEVVVRKTPEIFDAVNFNGLVFFLIANLLTGIVNMRIKTLYVSPIYAVCLLTSYSAICLTIVFVLYRYNIKLKL